MSGASVRVAVPALVRAACAVRRVARAVRWYVTSMMGEGAYAAYRTHALQQHPGAPVLDEREFWRERMAEQDRDPGARCC